MKVNPRDLRIDPPRLDAPDHVIEQLSALASENAGKSARRRGAIVAGVTAGVLALGMGGAWASGTLEVPGMPKPGRTAPVDPSPGDRPAPTPTTSEVPSPSGSSETTQPGAHGSRESRPDDRPGRTPEGIPSVGSDPERGGSAPGQREAEERRPEHAGTPKSPRSQEAGRPDDPGKPGQTGKPASPRGSGHEKRSKQRNGPLASSGATDGQRSAKRSDRAGAAVRVKERRDD